MLKTTHTLSKRRGEKTLQNTKPHCFRMRNFKAIRALGETESPRYHLYSSKLIIRTRRKEIKIHLPRRGSWSDRRILKVLLITNKIFPLKLMFIKQWGDTVPHARVKVWFGKFCNTLHLKEILCTWVYTYCILYWKKYCASDSINENVIMNLLFPPYLLKYLNKMSVKLC